MNRLVRSMNWFTPGAASRASRIRQPVPGNATRSAAIVVATSVPGGSTARSACSAIAPGASSPVRGNDSSPISTRGPKIDALDTRSGSSASTARSTNGAPPSRTMAPGCTPRRSSTSRSATSPSASAGCTGPGGSSTAVPSNGQAPSTAFNSTSNRSPEGATSIDRMVTASDTFAPRPRSHTRNSSGKACAPPCTDRSPPRMRAPSARQPALNALAQRANRGNRRHTQRQTGQHNPQPPHAATQLAPRQPQDEAHGWGDSKQGQGRCPWTPPRAERPLDPIRLKGCLKRGVRRCRGSTSPPSSNNPSMSGVQGRALALLAFFRPIRPRPCRRRCARCGRSGGRGRGRG